MNILIGDMMALYHRSYHGTKTLELSNEHGFPTHAIVAFLHTLFGQANSFNADLVIFCTEGKGGREVRQQISPDYKANRSSEPLIGFADQYSALREILPSLGIPILSVPKFEADDLIAAITKGQVLITRESDEPDDGWTTSVTNSEKPEDHHRFRVVTVDNDLLQLVNENTEVFIWRPFGAEELYTNDQEVKNYYGCTAKQVLTYKALVGDSSDNIKGCKGFGKKSVKEFFDSYEDFYQASDDNFSKLSTRTRNVLQKLPLESYKLNEKLVAFQPSHFAAPFTFNTLSARNEAVIQTRVNNDLIFNRYKINRLKKALQTTLIDYVKDFQIPYIV